MKLNLEDQAHVILIVEDHPDMRAYLVQHFTKYYRVLEATDGMEGFEMAKKHVPTLILSDIMMPRIDGIEFCRRIKAHEDLKSIPFILLSAKASEEKRIEGLETGADDYVTKPFHMRELTVRIHHLLAARKIGGLQETKISISSAPDNAFLEKLHTLVQDAQKSSDLSIDDLSREMGLSIRQFQRKLKLLTGQTPREYVRYIRPEKVRKMMKNGTFATLAEAAYAVGFNKVFNKGNTDVIDELIAGDYIDHSAPPGSPRGPAVAKQAYTMFRTAFPDLRMNIEDMVAEGDKVVFRAV